MDPEYLLLLEDPKIRLMVLAWRTISVDLRFGDSPYDLHAEWASMTGLGIEEIASRHRLLMGSRILMPDGDIDPLVISNLRNRVSPDDNE